MYHNLYEVGGQQFAGSPHVSREQADKVAETAQLKRVAVVRCYPKMFITVTKL